MENHEDVIKAWVAERGGDENFWIGVASNIAHPKFKSNDKQLDYDPPLGTEACTFVKPEDKKWNTADCEDTNHFICEFPPVLGL